LVLCLPLLFLSALYSPPPLLQELLDFRAVIRCCIGLCGSLAFRFVQPPVIATCCHWMLLLLLLHLLLLSFCLSCSCCGRSRCCSCCRSCCCLLLALLLQPHRCHALTGCSQRCGRVLLAVAEQAWHGWAQWAVLRLVGLLLLLCHAERHVCQPDALGWAVVSGAVGIQQLQKKRVCSWVVGGHGWSMLQATPKFDTVAATQGVINESARMQYQHAPAPSVRHLPLSAAISGKRVNIAASTFADHALAGTGNRHPASTG
jgi:hypothetical protein